MSKQKSRYLHMGWVGRALDLISEPLGEKKKNRYQYNTKLACSAFAKDINACFYSASVSRRVAEGFKNTAEVSNQD